MMHGQTNIKFALKYSTSLISTDPNVPERHANLNIHLAFETLEPGHDVFRTVSTSLRSATAG
jgi:hypothetical protein